MPRLHDKVVIEEVGGSGGTALDNFTSLELINDITTSSSAAFELGNDGTFEEISDKIAPGVQYKTFLNDQLRLTGRIELEDIPADSGAGSVVRITVMSKISDAQFSSADPSVSVKKTSVKDFILAVYAPMGLTEADFIFDASVARDLMTGKSSSGQGSPANVDLEPMKIDAAKVQSSETIYAAADRHLRRHGLMHWDSPDGKIVVSSPNDTQDPIYFFRYMRGTAGAENNILGCTRTRDFTGIPSSIIMHGKTKGKPRRKIKAIYEDEDVTKAGFYRPVVLPDEGLRTQELLDRAVAREMSNRIRRKDAVNIEADGLSWWDGYENIPFAIDSVCNVNADVSGVEGGAYYIHRIVHRRNARQGDTTNITALKRGLWVL